MKLKTTAFGRKKERPIVSFLGGLFIGLLMFAIVIVWLIGG